MEKRVFADRAEYLGDQFVHVPIERLIDPPTCPPCGEVRPHEISPVDSVKPGLQEGMAPHFSILTAGTRLPTPTRSTTGLAMVWWRRRGFLQQ
jgi:gamma-glutamyltranspeptidase